MYKIANKIYIANGSTSKGVDTNLKTNLFIQDYKVLLDFDLKTKFYVK